MKKCAICGKPLDSGMVVHPECVPRWRKASLSHPEAFRNKYGELIPFLVCVDGTEYPFRAVYDGKNWGDGISKLNVKYWMPLPKPPEMEE